MRLTKEQFEKIKWRSQNKGRRKFLVEHQELYIEAFLDGAEYVCELLGIEIQPCESPTPEGEKEGE
jgi:hypothetical protein